MIYSLLNVGDRRVQLHKLFQAVNTSETMNGEIKICDSLANSMVQEIKQKTNIVDNTTKAARIFMSALNVAGFFVEGGWFVEAKKILSEIKQSNVALERRFESWNGSNMSELIVTECQMRLLHVTCVYCNFPEAETIYREMLENVPIPAGNCRNYGSTIIYHSNKRHRSIS